LKARFCIKRRYSRIGFLPWHEEVLQNNFQHSKEGNTGIAITKHEETKESFCLR